jgi:hypothetical protein
VTRPTDPFVERYGPTALALFVFVVGLLAQSDALVGVFYDDGIYVSLAKSLAEGTGYRSVHLPGAPPAVHYPPFYPAALSILWRLWPSFPANVALFQVFDMACLALAAALIARHARRLGGSPAERYGALALAFTAFPLLTLIGVRFSEPLFLLFAAAAVALADRDDSSLMAAAAAGACAGLAALTRSVGIAVVAGVPLGLWLNGRRGPGLAAAVTGAALVAPWFVWLRLQAGALDPRLLANYGTYLQYAAQAGVDGILAGLDLRGLTPFPRLFLSAVPVLAIWIVLALLLLGTIIWGSIIGARRARALVAVLTAYAGMIVLWPFEPDRFMWIVLPWVLLLGWAGARDLWVRGPAFRVPLAVLAVTATVSYSTAQAASLWEERYSQAARAGSGPFSILTAAIRAETGSDAVVASDGEALVYLYGERRTVPAYLFRLRGRGREMLPVDTAVAFWCENDVTHVGASWYGGEIQPLLDSLRGRGDSTLTPMFAMTSGPVLFEFRCSR